MSDWAKLIVLRSTESIEHEVGCSCKIKSVMGFIPIRASLCAEGQIALLSVRSESCSVQGGCGFMSLSSILRKPIQLKVEYSYYVCSPYEQRRKMGIRGEERGKQFIDNRK
ncbi:hypothetical protein NPIL_408131 [Nephila pilipes]|uniref:Uncharacterized protein n=1 Tax=Nephila pilipes TaxID=299642 RepID=A0A8X6QSL2_NEPPI|nr:hypothetical protein NPIL_408131 [Nephila pilipes]